MRHHDIERLKQAASRYRADATCLGDIEELVDYAIDVLASPPHQETMTQAAERAKSCIGYYHGGYYGGPELDAYNHGMRTVARVIQEWAGVPVDLPAAPHAPHKTDNGDGTETWRGLPVVVPVGLVPDDETPIEVRSRAIIPEYGNLPYPRIITNDGQVDEGCGSRKQPGELRLVLASKPAPITWTPPASLRDGEYKWNGSHLNTPDEAFCLAKNYGIRIMFADWTDPPRTGR